MTILALAAMSFGGCAQNPQQVAAGPHSKEYFPSSVYGPASRRVIADGQPVPHGGGQYLVGKPYTIAGQTYYPSERKITQVGLASWYGDAFHGRLTANGEIYDRDGFTAAHPTMPLPSYARVTNLRNNYSMIVRVNDRGPYHSNRVMDVSRRVAETLDFKRGGTSKVKVEFVGRASLAGSDDAKLYASLRTNGPAPVGGLGDPTMVAEAAPSPAHVASLEPYAPAPVHRTRVALENEPAAARAQAPEPRLPIRSTRHQGALAHDIQSAEHTPAHSLSRRDHQDHDMADARRAHLASSHNAEMRNPARMASLENGREARAFAAHELMPTARPGRAAAADLNHATTQKTALLGKHSREAALPPTRPGRIAAVAPAANHHAAGSRLTHARDD